MKTHNATFFKPLFEGDDPGNEPDPGNDPAPEPDPGNDPDPLENQDTFTKEQVEKIVQKRVANQTKTKDKLVAELEALRSKAQLTVEEKKDLENRIEQIQNESMSKEQLAAKERKKLQEKTKKDLEDLTSDRDQWKNRYTESTIERDLLDAASENKAISPKQIVRLFRSDSELVEELDKDKKPTGNLVTKVSLMDTDDEGNTVKLKLPPKEAIKRMAEMEEYENLFNYEGVGGVGRRNRPSGGAASDARELAARDPKAYMEARKSGKVKFDEK